MTILSRLSDNAPKAGPKYTQLEALFHQAVADGTLAPGDRLPPMRDAAWRAGCSLGTMARVYRTLERQGLVTSEVGRGTYVKDPDSLSANEILPAHGLDLGTDAPINLMMNEIAAPQGDSLLRSALGQAVERTPNDHLMGYCDGMGVSAYKARLTALLPESLLPQAADGLLVTHGVQNGLYTALSRLAGPGDAVAVEPFSYPGIRACLGQLGLSGVPVDMDAEGLRPDALEAACRSGRIRLLVTSPTGHNPTTATTGQERREDICKIAVKYGLTILEDDIYGFLYDRSTPPYAALLPEQSVYLTGLSKRVAPALRVGLAVASPQTVTLMAQGITTQSWMVSPVLVAATALLADRIETLDDIARDTAARADRRTVLLKEKLSPHVADVAACRSHAWITLPEGLTDDALCERARAEGVLVTAGHRFANRQGIGHDHIRVSLLSTLSDDQFVHGLDRLTTALRTADQPETTLSLM